MPEPLSWTSAFDWLAVGARALTSARRLRPPGPRFRAVMQQPALAGLAGSAGALIFERNNHRSGRLGGPLKLFKLRGTLHQVGTADHQGKDAESPIELVVPKGCSWESFEVVKASPRLAVQVRCRSGDRGAALRTGLFRQGEGLEFEGRVQVQEDLPEAEARRRLMDMAWEHRCANLPPIAVRWDFDPDWFLRLRPIGLARIAYGLLLAWLLVALAEPLKLLLYQFTGLLGLFAGVAGLSAAALMLLFEAARLERQERLLASLETR